MDAQFKISDHKKVQVLKVSELVNDAYSNDILLAARGKIEQGFPNFIVDLSAVRYMNSAGINFLIRLKRHSEEKGGHIAVANASDKIKELLDLTKLRRMFPLSESVEDAIRGFPES